MNRRGMGVALAVLLAGAILLVAPRVAERLALGGGGGAAGPVDLRAIGFAAGSDDAPVTVVEFSDFGCPFCAMFSRGTYPEIAAELVETGEVRWLFVPFESGQFRNGADSERAARCSAEQGAFDRMKARVYAGQREWLGERRPGSIFAGYAAAEGLDVEAFERCYEGDAVGETLRASRRAAEALDVRATPTFLIGDRRLEGALPARRFIEVLRREVEAAGVAEAGGAPGGGVTDPSTGRVPAGGAAGAGSISSCRSSAAP